MNGYTTRMREKGVENMDRLALVLVIIGAVNWLLVGLFQWDLIAALFNGESSFLSRVIYSLVGLAGLYCLSLLFRDRATAK